MKSRMKKYTKEIIFVIVIILISFIIFKIGNKLAIDGIALCNLSGLIFDSLIGLIAIWLSAYFILIQLYKNRYPMEIIEKSFLKKVKFILIYSIINIMVGMLTLTIYCDLISQVYFIVLFLINIFIIFWNSYTINRTFTLNTYIEKYFKKITNDLEMNNINEEKIDNVFYDIHKLFDECIVKEEYYVCNSITEKNGELFQKLIEHCNRLLASEDKQKAMIAEYILKKIINSGIYQIKSAKHIENKTYLVELFRQQERNIRLCLKIKNIEWFKKYITKLNELARDYNDNEILDNLYSMNVNIGEELLLEKEKMYIEWFIKEIYDLNLSLKYIYNNVNLKYFGKLLMLLLITDNEKNNSENYEVLKEILENFTKEITYGENDIQDVVIYYQLYGSEIIHKKDLNQVKKFIKIITNKKNRLLDNERWNAFILFYLNVF